MDLWKKRLSVKVFRKPLELCKSPRETTEIFTLNYIYPLCQGGSMDISFFRCCIYGNQLERYHIIKFIIVFVLSLIVLLPIDPLFGTRPSLLNDTLVTPSRL